MSGYVEYANRLAEQYADLEYTPLSVRRGPRYAHDAWQEFKEKLLRARKLLRDDDVNEYLRLQPRIELLRRIPYGPPIPVPDIVRRHSRVVLTAGAGAGKSTALRYLAANPLPIREVRLPVLDEGEEADLLTIIVDLPDWISSGQPLPDYLADDASRRFDLDTTPDFFTQVLLRGQALLCFDGLNHISGQEARVQAVRQIESLADMFPLCRYAITVRDNAYAPELERETFAHGALTPWRTDVIAHLEEEWQDADEERLAAAPPLVREMLAAREWEKRCVSGELEQVWQEVYDSLWDLSKRGQITLLFHFLAQDYPGLCGQLLVRIREAGKNDPFERVMHRHLLVMADVLAIGAGDEVAPTVRRRIVDDLVDWLGDAQAVGRQDAIDALLRLKNEAYACERVLSLLNETEAFAREAAALILGTLGGSHPAETVDALRARLNDDEEELVVRQAAAFALGNLIHEGLLDDQLASQVEQELLARLRNPELNMDMRVVAGDALTLAVLRTQDAEVINTLFSLARGEGEEEKVPYLVQITAARGLSQLLPAMNDPEMVKRAWELAQDEKVDDGVRCELAETLGRLDDPERAARVLIALARDPKVYPPGWRAALEALGRVGYCDQSIVDELVAIAESTDRRVKDFVRMAAAYALSRLGHLDLAVQHMLMLVADKSIFRDTRKEALTYLGEMGTSGDEAIDEAAISVLQVWATEENTTEDVCELAMESLRMLKVSRRDVIDDLVALVRDRRTYPRVRRAAAATLGQLPVEDKEAVVEELSKTFYDQEEKNDLLRVPIARILHLWGKDEHAMEYLRLVAEKSYMAQARHIAGITLGELGEEKEAVRWLLALAENADIVDTIRCDSLRHIAMWAVGDQETAERVKAIAQDADLEPNVREAAYAALKSITAI